MTTILCVAGARPNFVKIAPLMAEMRRYPDKIEPFWSIRASTMMIRCRASFSKISIYLDRTLIWKWVPARTPSRPLG